MITRMNSQSPGISAMPSANRIILASAGSGKTTTVVQETCGDVATRSALITYTLNGRGELTDKAYGQFGAVPPNVSISTWYTFVLTHFVRPYQNHLYCPRVSAINFNRVPTTPRVPKTATSRYFFSSKGRVWRDRVTDFACQVIDKTRGLPLTRIEKIFGRIYVDEAQDLAGWDLELMEHLLKSETEIVLVGDHRQATYSTNDNPKNKAYWGEKIIKKFAEWEKSGLAKIEYQSHSHRCNQTICNFADQLFPDCPKTTSHNGAVTGHDGVFLVSVSDLDRYCKTFSPQALRYDKRTNIAHGKPLNFGEAKGMTFERTIIYPHGPFQKYLKTGHLADAGKALAKTYVAVTRARQSVAIVVPDDFKSAQLTFFTFDD